MGTHFNPLGDTDTDRRKTMSIKDLVIKAHEAKKLRYAPKELDLSSPVMLDLSRTGMSGVEFEYDPETDTVLWATQTIDGFDLDPDEFVRELAEAVGENPEDYVTERRWLVTERTSVTASSAEEAIEKVVAFSDAHQHVEEQSATPIGEQRDEWPVHVVVLQFARDPETDDPINWDWTTLLDMAHEVQFVTGGVLGHVEVNG